MMARRQNRFTTFRLVAAAGVTALALAGCPNTEGRFDDFIDRHEDINGIVAGTGGATTCMPAAAGELDGDFFFALSASLDPGKPIMFLAATTLADGANGLELNITLQAVDAADRTTPVGPEIVLPTSAVGADGVFTMDLPMIEVVGAANGITGNDLAATITLTGNACADSVDFYCGTVEGDVTKPLDIPIPGSTFAAERVTGTPYPEPPMINCAGDLAGPLGS